MRPHRLIGARDRFQAQICGTDVIKHPDALSLRPFGDPEIEPGNPLHQDIRKTQNVFLHQDRLRMIVRRFMKHFSETINASSR